MQAEGVENLSGYERVLDRGQNVHPRAATETVQDIQRDQPRYNRARV